MCFFFKEKTAYEMRISDWSSDVCSSDLNGEGMPTQRAGASSSTAFRDAGDDVGGLLGSFGGFHARRQGREPRLHHPVAEQPLDGADEPIGRASCRERVCHYV